MAFHARFFNPLPAISLSDLLEMKQCPEESASQFIERTRLMKGHCPTVIEESEMTNLVVRNMHTGLREALTAHNVKDLANLASKAGRLESFFREMHAPNDEQTEEGDVAKLHRQYGIVVSNFVDLNTLHQRACVYADPAAHVNRGLKAMVGAVLGKELPKPLHVTLSNWDSDFLTDEQVDYAATDAFVTLLLGIRLTFLIYRISQPFTMYFPVRWFL
ncbi:uncharacterized protein LOC127251228 [Andrographis paniculata]|uniref:uncharacterized protein LOC127251228 n=1 Tax=Andrographis paniculata TaxID=175694 RepID=UPI0021E71784|nr:uncharacterized protein LOC127251228 [Andrographis paniculata]